MAQTIYFEIRLAGPTDVDAISEAHLDSIHSLGPQYYSPDIVGIWASPINRDLYLDAMAGGEVFFISVGELDGESTVLGFSSHRVDDGQHGVSVYVRGGAARRGIGSALLQAAEAHAVEAGAPTLQLKASLAAAEFYTTHGYRELSQGTVDLVSGHQMPCVFMSKRLDRDSLSGST